jgi:hypothetical protein
MSVELVERYLQAVRMLLPRKQGDDVARELAEEIQSQIEDREAGLGRTATPDEIFAILKGFGHPALLALRYQESRSLIGPRVFPLYWFSVKAILAFLTVVHVVLPAVFDLTMGESSARVIGHFLAFPNVAMVAVAWTTLCFVVLDTDVVHGAVLKALADWKPADLPSLPREKPEPPFIPALAGVLGFAILSAWWLVGLHHPGLLLGPSASVVGFGPVFYRLYVPMVVLAAIGLLLGLVRVARPGLAWNRVAELALEAANLVMLFFVSRGGPWIVLAPGAGSADLPALIDLVNETAALGLGVAFVVAGVAFAFKCVKVLRRVSSAPRALAA